MRRVREIKRVESTGLKQTHACFVSITSLNFRRLPYKWTNHNKNDKIITFHWILENPLAIIAVNEAEAETELPWHLLSPCFLNEGWRSEWNSVELNLTQRVYTVRTKCRCHALITNGDDHKRREIRQISPQIHDVRLWGLVTLKTTRKG